MHLLTGRPREGMPHRSTLRITSLPMDPMPPCGIGKECRGHVCNERPGFRCRRQPKGNSAAMHKIAACGTFVSTCAGKQHKET